MAKDEAAGASKPARRVRPKWDRMELLQLWLAAVDWGRANPEGDAVAPGMEHVKEADALRDQD